MKHSIEGFDQRIAVGLGLDAVDLVILRWFVDFSVDDKMEKTMVEGKLFYWISYDYLISELPIIDLKKLAVYRRLTKMVECGVLTHYTSKSKGTYSMYGFGSNYSMLVYEKDIGTSQKIEGSIAKDRGGISQKIDQRSFYQEHSINNVAEPSHGKEKEKKRSSKPRVKTPCPVTPDKQSDSVIDFTLQDGTYWVTKQFYDTMVEIHPGIDHLAEFRKMKGWLLTNENKRKTPSGVGAFVDRWLGNASDKKEEKVPLKEEKEREGYYGKYKFVN